MKSKKIIMYFVIIFIIIIILFIGYLVCKNIKSKNVNNILEIIPEEEITEEQLRQTIITLYFMNMDTGKLMGEARKIDAKMLIEEPCKVLIQLLIDGPKNERLTKLIPESTKINDIKIINNIAYLDFSKEFIEEQSLGKEQEELIINSIVNTLTQLNEISGIYIKIEGQDNLEFPDGMVKFNNIFKLEK